MGEVGRTPTFGGDNAPAAIGVQNQPSFRFDDVVLGIIKSVSGNLFKMKSTCFLPPCRGARPFSAFTKG